MRLIFAGSGSFGATILDALHNSAHEITQVLSQPDRPAGRRMRLTATFCAAQAHKYKLPLLQPARLDEDALDALRANDSEVFVVADFGQLIPASWLDLCPSGTLNVHPSLLPRWRGAAPIARAIEAGETESGCTLMLMNEQLDAGDILRQQSIAFAADETSASAHVKLAALGADMLLRYLDDFPVDHPDRVAQDEDQVCFAPALSKTEAALNWQQDAERLACKIRAFNPQPVATARCGDEVLRLWQAHASDQEHSETPGTVVRSSIEGIFVACGSGMLCITELQRPGGRRLSAQVFCNARRLDGLRLS